VNKKREKLSDFEESSLSRVFPNYKKEFANFEANHKKHIKLPGVKKQELLEDVFLKMMIARAFKKTDLASK
jgi:hypothetical protein